MFEPPLSQEKQKSIDRMGMGIVDKFFLTFGVEDGHSTAERQHQLLWSHKDVASFLQGHDRNFAGLLLRQCRPPQSYCQYLDVYHVYPDSIPSVHSILNRSLKRSDRNIVTVAYLFFLRSLAEKPASAAS